MNLSNEESRNVGKNEEKCLDVGKILSSFRPIFRALVLYRKFVVRKVSRLVWAFMFAAGGVFCVRNFFYDD